MQTAWTLAAFAALSLVASAQQAAPPQPGRPAAPAGRGREERTGGTSVMSPSVLASSSARRDDTGLFTVDILILWRGSPGWSFRRTGLGNMMSGGSPARDGSVSFLIHEGGLQLNASYDPASQAVVVLGERVELKGANVVFVDRVDSPDGPVIAKTTTIAPTRAPLASVPALLRDVPELLAYLRCEAQLPDPINQVPMNRVCAEAIVRGLVNAPRTVTPVPTGPVTNRAAATGPPPAPERPAGAGESSGNGLLSPVVVGGWFTHREPTGAAYLDLLVLWRGAVGWAFNDSAGGSSGGGLGSSRRGMTVRRGDLSLYAAFNGATRTYQIDDQTGPLGDDNVVLVDEVDSARGPRVVKTLRIDPALPDTRRVDVAIARSPELVAYLRCDIKLPDARRQTVMDQLCARYGAK